MDAPAQKQSMHSFANSLIMMYSEYAYFAGKGANDDRETAN